MSRAEKLFLEWSKQCPTDVPVEEFDILVRHFLGRWLEVKKGGSHRYHVTHEVLTGVSDNSGFNTLTISVVGGRKVRDVYVRSTLKAIRDIYKAENLPLPEE